jgi:protein-glutamine gamma-glutamyltransferase
MTFEKFFRIISYMSVLCGFLSLWVSGSFGVVATGLFFSVMVLAWFLEDSRWQISERLGTALIVLALPVFFIGWRYQFANMMTAGTALAGILGRLILALSSIKLLQKKSGRDWIFLYLMAFFEVLLGAGLSISALYLVSFLLYLLVTVCAVVAFEIRKTTDSTGKKAAAGEHIVRLDKSDELNKVSIGRLPLTAAILIVAIAVLAVPTFFMLPRVGGAGFGSSQKKMPSTGFSSQVRLGDIGRIQQSDETVMRVRVEDAGAGSLYWRGIALDNFDGQAWTRTDRDFRDRFIKGEKEYIQVDSVSGKNNLVLQTVYLEPIDTPVLFALSRPVLVQGGGFDFLEKDNYGAISFRRNEFERITYKILSDRTLPPIDKLRADTSVYPVDVARMYLQLPPRMDARIGQRAEDVIRNAGNRYDKAKALESYLQNSFGYTLDLKASGEDPLADFLFNVKEGHCEYFATAMAVMLRTQGIAARVVNGFQQGDYNDTAGIYVVKQKNAHSWVEVYFAGEDGGAGVWVPFDPTPFAGQSTGTGAAGIAAQFNKYVEALETMWIEYFVAYDDVGQRSLLRSVREGFTDVQVKSSTWIDSITAVMARWWQEVRGDHGIGASLIAMAYGAAYLLAFASGVLLIVWLYRKARKLELWKRVVAWFGKNNEKAIVEFYERMQKILATRGFNRPPHQTPLEFAFALGMPEAVKITEKYNGVRFGEKALTSDEARNIEDWLGNLESGVLVESEKENSLGVRE